MTAENAYRPRARVDGFPIGCPARYGEAPCHTCGGEWPGNHVPSETLIEIAKSGEPIRTKKFCGTILNQYEFLVKKFSPNGK